MTVLIKGARVLTMDAKGTEHACADILVEGSRIAAIAPAIEVGPHVEVMDGSERLALPGLINAHLHSPGNFMKGALDGAPLEIFMLREVPPTGDAPEPARLHYLRTALGAVEMLKLGITSVLDDAFFNPLVTDGAVDAVMGAYRDTGMRATVTLDQPTLPELEKYPFLAELVPPADRARLSRPAAQSEPEMLEIYRHFVERWHGSEDGRLRCGASCSAPQRVSAEYLKALTALSAERDLPFVIHILETRLQRVLGQVKHARSFVRYVDELGCLDERKQVVHAIWIDEEDVARLARSGCTVAHNPISNLRIGSGVMPFRALREAGVPICLGTDEAGVDDTANVWNVLKLAGLVHNVTDPDWRRWPKPGELLDCLWQGGARAMHQEGRIGVLAPGAQADIALLDLDTVAFTPLTDLRRQLVYCENGSSVRTVFVQGRRVVDEGRLTTIDEKALLAEVRAATAAFAEGWARIEAEAQRLEPAYAAMLERALAVPVGMLRWVPPFGREPPG